MHGAGMAENPRFMPAALCGWNCRKAGDGHAAPGAFFDGKGAVPMNSAERREGRYRRRRARREEKKMALLAGRGFDEALGLDALNRAARDAARGVSYKESVQRFMLRRMTSCADLRERLESGRDVHRGFKCFTVIERGKLRQIMSVRYSERVVQKALNQNALLPAMGRRLIHDNGASLKGKGTGFSIRRLTCHLMRHYRRYGNAGYVLQVDVRNYFGSIDHGIAKEMARRSLGDERLAGLACRLVDSYYEHYKKADPSGARPVGLGLGSEVNQTLAVAYLDPLDHYVKETLRVKAYGRYNDDFYLIHPDKEFLKECLEGIREKCAELKVEPNERKTRIVPLSHGFTFLKTQFLLTGTGRVVRRPCREAIARERRRLKRQKRLADAGVLDERDARASFESWKGSMKRKDARRSVRNMELLYGRLFGKGDAKVTEIERQNVDNEIAANVQMLANTDYKAIKHAEGAMTDEEYEETKAERQAWRDRINELQALLAAGAEGGGGDA